VVWVGKNGREKDYKVMGKKKYDRETGIISSTLFGTAALLTQPVPRTEGRFIHET
jgi:hypothetical protein